MRNLAFILIALIFIVSCEDDSTTSNKISRISGTVTDKRTGKGLSYAYIQIFSSTDAICTDTLGHFEINNIPENTYKIIVAKDGYITGSMNIRTFSNREVYASIPLAPVSDLQGLVAYYTFNGNAKDESGNSHDGIVKGPIPNIDRKGRPNASFYFNGNNYIEIPYSIDFNFLNGFTITAWIYPLFSMCKPNNSIIDIVSFLSEDFFDIAITSDKSLEYIIKTGKKYDYSKTFSDRIIDQQWNHIAVVYQFDPVQDFGSLTLYINGKLITFGGTEIHPVISNSSLIIGSRSDHSSYFAGSIDEVYVFKRALNDSELEMLVK